MKHSNKQKGFTIVELLIVIVVIAILAAISIVAFTGIQQRGRDSAKASDVGNIVKALTAYTADGNAWPENVANARTELAAYRTANLSSDITGKLTLTAAPATTSTNYSYVPCTTSGTRSGARIGYFKENTTGSETNPITVTAGVC